MKTALNGLARVGDYLAGLSDRSRLWLVTLLVILLIGGGTYKLIGSIRGLSHPAPAANVQEWMRPMGATFQGKAQQYRKQKSRQQQSLDRLDSLARVYQSKLPKKP